MARMQEPTRAQLRQHALDQALVEAVVYRVAAGIGGEVYDPKPEEMAEGIVKVAKTFEAYLEEAIERQGPTIHEATLHEMLAEIEERGNILQNTANYGEEGRLLSAYTVDISNRLGAKVLGWRRTSEG